jgi:ABC-type branched-subunit amino acid transport system substrate-binding protein
MKILFTIAILLLPVFALAENSPEIRIGVIASLTGPAADQGTSWVKGAEAAAKELKRSGININLIVEDDATTPAKAATAFTKLSKVNKVQAIVAGTWDFLFEAIAPLAKRDHIPLLTPSNPPEIFSSSSNNNSWVFTNGLSVAAEEKVFRELLIKKNIKSLGLISVQVPFSLIHREMVLKVAKELQLQILIDDELPLEGFMNVLKISALKAAEKRPDAIYAGLDEAATELILRELEILKYSPVFIGSQHVESAYLSSQNKERYKNAIGIYPAYDRSKFDALYKSFYNERPRVFASHGFDAINFFTTALQNAVKFDDPKANFNFQGITGAHTLPPKSGTRSIVESKAVARTLIDEEFKDLTY